MRVLADNRNRHLPFGLTDAVDNRLPPLEVGLGSFEPKMAAYLPVETLQVIGYRHCIDRIAIKRRNDPAFAQIAEQRDLLAGGRRDRPLAAAQQDIGLDAEAEKLLGRMLGRLGLQLACRGDPRHQRQMHEEDTLTSEFVAELADRLKEWQAFDVADRAADFAEDEIFTVEIGLDEFLDRVSDVGDDLHRRPEILAAPFAADYRRVDSPGGDRVTAPRRAADKALIVAKIEIGLGPVVGDETLAVLIGAHSARV